MDASAEGNDAIRRMTKREMGGISSGDYDQAHHAWADLNLNEISIPLRKEFQDYKLGYLRNTGSGFLNSIAD